VSILERGFKSWGERFSEGLRKELGLDITDPLDLDKLAAFAGCRVMTPHDIPGMTAEHLQQLTLRDSSGWSAVTVCVGDQAVIIHNPTHSVGRQASNIAHEIAHVLLQHEPTRIVMSHDGTLVMRSFDAKQEEEANWLAWCILLPREAVMSALRRRMSVEQIAAHFGVSVTLVRFRIQKTGAQVHMKRTSGQSS